MTDMEKMVAAAGEAMKHVMSLAGEDRVLVVTDQHTRNVGDAFYKAAEGRGCEVALYEIPEAGRPYSEVPEEMEALLQGKSVVINAFKGFSEETPFRVKWIRAITGPEKIRLGHCPNITEAMMTEGPMNVDYKKMLDDAKGLMNAFENAVSAHITAPGGTDVTIHIEDRAFKTDVKITKDNAGNLPCGEIWCGPVEDRAEGIIVIDGSIGDLGNVAKPLKITVAGGSIFGLESEDQELVKEVEKLVSVDSEASVIGELGIGLNPGAKLTGNLLEDEKALDTAHIAFGNNDEMPGGRNRSKTHRDFLFYKPTFEVTFKDGS
ncbi:MAG: aminopeptidase, partial [Planctomycetota bacterium]